MKWLRLPKGWQAKENRLARYAALGLILLGCGLRIVLWVQNRNLIIDEANIARNLAERGFGGLLLPLKFEQFAPPVFLWIEKLASLLGGYGEMSLRLPSLLAGIVALPVFWKIARQYMPGGAALAALALVCTSYLLVKYSVELKQYMPDALVSLTLIALAFRVTPERTQKNKFIVFWMIAGTLAVWGSMPSVFTLAGVWAYFAWPVLRGNSRVRWTTLLLIGSVWLFNFTVYYFLILKAQANSEYLQGYHHDYFLFGWPRDAAEWEHDKMRLMELLSNAGSYDARWQPVNLGLILLGIADLARRNGAKLLLIGLPLLLTLVAAMLKQFSLIDRVVLFLIPLIIILMATGLGALLRLRLWPVHLAAGLYTIVLVTGFNCLWIFNRPLRFHEITAGMDFLNARNAAGKNVYVHDANTPTFRYYTEMHPDRARYATLKQDAHLLTWQADYTALTAGLQDTSWFIYTGGFAEDEKKRRVSQIEVNMRQVSYFTQDICFVYGYVPKSPDSVSAVSVDPN